MNQQTEAKPDCLFDLLPAVDYQVCIFHEYAGNIAETLACKDFQDSSEFRAGPIAMVAAARIPAIHQSPNYFVWGYGK